MRLARERSPEITDKLRGSFIADGGYNRDVVASELYARLTACPEDVLVLVCWAGREVKGFLTAWAPVNRGYVWLDQAYKHSSVPDVLKKAAMEKLKLFAREKGRAAIRTESERSSLAIQKKYGWNEHGVILEMAV